MTRSPARKHPRVMSSVKSANSNARRAPAIGAEDRPLRENFKVLAGVFQRSFRTSPPRPSTLLPYTRDVRTHRRRRCPMNRRYHALAILALLLCTASSGVRAQTAPTSDFSVTLLGTGIPVPQPDRYGPATLVEVGGQKLLFDAGRGATIRLFQLQVPLREVGPLFLTHLHSDHTVGIP